MPRTYYLKTGNENAMLSTTLRDCIWSDYSYQGCPLSYEDDHKCYITADTLYINYGTPRDRTVVEEPDMFYSTSGRDYSYVSTKLPEGFNPARCAIVHKNTSDWQVHIYEADNRTYVIYNMMTCAIVEQGVRAEPVDVTCLW